MADSSGASLSPALGQAGGASARAPAKQKRQSREKAGHGRQGVSWRSTFIELGDDDAERQSSLSPRPSSEPCSESSSSVRAAFFDADRSCVAALSKQMEEAWASNSREKMRQLLSRDWESDSQSASGATRGDGAAEGEAARPARRGVVELAVGRRGDAAEAEGGGGASSASQAIRAIPEGVGAFLHQHSRNLVAQVQGEVAEVHSLLSEMPRLEGGARGAPAQPLAEHVQWEASALDSAICEFEEIPGRIQATFEASIARATELFWMRVGEVMKSLGDKNSSDKEVVNQMRMIPREVQQIAAEAVEQAVLDSQVEVSRMCDSLIATLEEKRWNTSSQKVSSMKARICEQVPRTIHPTILAAMSAASASVEQAVKAYQDPELPVPVPNQLANEMVAECLLRVKAETPNSQCPPGRVEVQLVHAQEGASYPEQVRASMAPSSASPLVQKASKSDCPLQHELQHTKAGGSDSGGSVEKAGWIRRPMVDVMSEPCVSKCRQGAAAIPSGAMQKQGQASGNAASHEVVSGEGPFGTSRAEIRSRIHAKAERASFKQRLSAAAEAIDSIPEQLNSVVQNKANSLADSVETDLALVQRAIRSSGGDDAVVDVAIDQLGAIPEIIRSSFDSKISEASDTIRSKLNTIMQGFKNSKSERHEVVDQLWTIPEELEQITGEAVDQAVQESKREAAKHCDRVLRSLPENAGVSRRALKDAKLQIVEAVPEMYSETMRALRRATNANVKHAVAHVDDQPEVRVTNRLVADVLLRAKVGSLPQADVASASQSSQSATGMVPRVDDGGDPEGDTVDQDGLADAIGGPGLADAEGTPAELRGQRRVDALAGVVENPVGPEVTPPAEDDLPRTLLVEGAPALPPGLADPYESACHNNAGSMGHPEMCVRPCLYFSRGQCTNGNECRFCHYQHPTRPVHLGRQHRKTLEGASVAQCFTISLPVLEQKLATLGLPTDTLWAHASQCAAQGGGGAAEAGGKVKARELRTLEKAFGALSLRSLLVVLQRKTGAQASREKALLDTVLKKLREVGYLVDIGEEVPRDD